MRMRPMPKHAFRCLALAAALAASGCTETFVGYQAEFASNTVAVRAHPPSGDRLTFFVPKRTTELQKRTVHLAARNSVLHLRGYLPMTPDGVDDAGEQWEVRVTVPRHVEKGTKIGTRAIGGRNFPCTTPRAGWAGSA
jgi:hypothetical protein